MTNPVRQCVWWVISCAFLVGTPCHGDVRIDPGTSPDSETAALAQALRKELAGQQLNNAAPTTVTVGLAAFREALAAKDGLPIVATYITSTEFYSALGEQKRPPSITAVFSNPDPLDQVALAETLLGRPSMGAFASPGVAHLVSRLKPVGVQTIAAPPQRGMESLLQGAFGLNAIIALPDAAVINRTNISHVVRALYQRRAVLIGYSQTLTRAGSLAAVYVGPEAMTAQIALVTAEANKGGALPEPVFVRDVSIAVNEQLAHSLNIAVPASEDLITKFRARRKDSSR